MPVLPCLWRRLRAALHLGGSATGREADEARAAERERIAADLHDGPLQCVIALQLRLAAAKTLCERDPATALKGLGELADLATEVVAELRSFLRTMQPPAVETTELGALAQRLVEVFAADTDLEVRFEPPGVPLSTTPETCLGIAQILREALTNVRKHARAGRVEVVLAKLADSAEISVEDNGVGFPFSGTMTLEELDRQDLGPRSIRQRVRSVRGELTLESRPGQGSRLAIRIPL